MNTTDVSGMQSRLLMRWCRILQITTSMPATSLPAGTSVRRAGGRIVRRPDRDHHIEITTSITEQTDSEDSERNGSFCESAPNQSGFVIQVTDWLLENPCFSEGKTCFVATGSTKRVDQSASGRRPLASCTEPHNRAMQTSPVT